MGSTFQKGLLVTKTQRNTFLKETLPPGTWHSAHWWPATHNPSTPTQVPEQCFVQLFLALPLSTKQKLMVSEYHEGSRVVLRLLPNSDVKCVCWGCGGCWAGEVWGWGKDVDALVTPSTQREGQGLSLSMVFWPRVPAPIFLLLFVWHGFRGTGLCLSLSTAARGSRVNLSRSCSIPVHVHPDWAQGQDTSLDITVSLQGQIPEMVKSQSRR